MLAPIQAYFSMAKFSFLKSISQVFIRESSVNWPLVRSVVGSYYRMWKMSNLGSSVKSRLAVGQLTISLVNDKSKFGKQISNFMTVEYNRWVQLTEP